MIDKKTPLKFLSVALASIVFLNPSQALAWGGHDGHRDRDHGRGDWDRDYRHGHDHYRYRNFPPYRYPYPRHGSIIFDLPFGAVKVVVGGHRYYYCDGVFYNRSNIHYVVIPPPVGAAVTLLPVGMQPIIVNGVTYYTADGVYYQYTSRGYVVVPQPTVTVVQTAQAAVPVTVAPTAVTTSAPAVTEGEVYTVNISNSQGGYTAVAIKKSGDGFIGPQGEYYEEFPKVDQLKLMYGK